MIPISEMTDVMKAC